MPADPQRHCELYRLLIAIPQRHEILLKHLGQAMELPYIEIPQYTRPAEEITAAILAEWSLQTVVIDWIVGEDGKAPCAVLEVRPSLQPLTLPGLGFCSIDRLPDGILSGAVLDASRKLFAGASIGRGPFSRFGWIDVAQQWIRTSAGEDALEFTDIRQLNASTDYALLRLGTLSGKAFWLKAIGEPNTREYSTTRYLTEHCTKYLPRIVSMRADWSAWVMEEFGSSLHCSKSFVDFEHAVVRLASLQKELLEKTPELLATHFVDHRLATLDSHVDELIAYLDESMPQQTSTRVKPLSSRRLKNIGALLHDACDSLQSLEIPDSVMHGDISPGSILNNGVDCVFTDWCEAYVGNPFITLEQFCVHATRVSEESATWAPKLKARYKSCWSDILTSRQIDQALELVPLISVLSYLYGRGDWLSSPRRLEPSFQSYSRSLARHMDRLAPNPEQTEVI